MKCSNCQANLPNNAQFCAYCGQKMVVAQKRPSKPTVAKPKRPSEKPQVEPPAKDANSKAAGIIGTLMIIVFAVVLGFGSLYLMATYVIAPFFSLPSKAEEVMADAFSEERLGREISYRIIDSERATYIYEDTNEMWCVLIEVYPPDNNNFYAVVWPAREGGFWELYRGRWEVNYLRSKKGTQKLGCDLADGYELAPVSIP